MCSYVKYVTKKYRKMYPLVKHSDLIKHPHKQTFQKHTLQDGQRNTKGNAHNIV